MICPNKECNKSFDTPLEIFNGDLLCPHCKKNIFSVGKIELTRENVDIYEMSELYLLKSISKENNQGIIKDTITLSKNELLDNAIKICQQSAQLGNPNAIFRMGFYNEYCMKATKSKKDRLKTAFDYYLLLALNDSVSVPVKNGVTPMSDDDFYKLKRTSAINVLLLCEKHESLLNTNNGIDIDSIKQKIKSTYNDLDITGRDSVEETNNAQYVLSVLNTCFSKDRAPLFGTFFLSGADYKQLCNSKDNKINRFFKYISKGIEIRYAQCNDNGKIFDDGFYKISNTNRAIELSESLRDIDNLYLFFYNTKGKHKYLNAKQLDIVRKELTNNDFALLYRLIVSESQDYLFFDDDIEIFKVKNNVNGCIEKLIDLICGE